MDKSGQSPIQLHAFCQCVHVQLPISILQSVASIMWLLHRHKARQMEECNHGKRLSV